MSLKFECPALKVWKCGHFNSEQHPHVAVRMHMVFVCVNNEERLHSLC